MMKRVLCLMLCLVMALGAVCAFAEEDYSLSEKLQRQIDFGNGVKGAVVLNAQGESDWARMLAVLNGTEIQIRSIKEMNGEKHQLYLYTLSGEEQVGLTRFYGDSQNLYMSSVLLPELVLTLHTGGDLIEAMSDDGENTNWLSAAANIMTVPETTWEETWAPALEGYYSDIELWLAEYADDPQVNQSASGETLMTVRYEIPADAVKAEIKVLLQKALNDETLMGLLRGQTTEEQQLTYLTPGFMYYYEAAVDAMPISGEILLERDLSTMGEILSTSVQLPLPEATGWQMLTMDQTESDMSVSLVGEKMTVALEMETAAASATSANYSGVVRVTPADDSVQAAAVAFRLTKVYSYSVDDDTREHDVTTWTLDVAADESVAGDEDYLAFEPIQASLMTHIHSKSAKRNATTLEFTAGYAQGTDSLSLAGSIKTTSPWVLDDLSAEGAEDVTAMTESYLLEIMGTLWSNLQTELSAMQPAELPEPEAAPAAATSTDVQLATSTDQAP